MLHSVTSKKAQMIFRMQTILDALVCLSNFVNLLQLQFDFSL